MIASGGRGQLVQETLDDPGHGAGTRRAPRPARSDQRQQGLRELVVRNVLRGKFLVGQVATADRVLAVGGERYEVIAPGDEFAFGIDAAGERVESARAVEVVRHVLLARPHELHGSGEALRDGAGFAGVVVHEAAAESAAQRGSG